VHLVEQMQDDRDPFIIDAEVLAQVADELRTRQVDVGEHGFGGGLRRNQPSGCDPGFHRLLLHPGADHEFVDRDHSGLQ
jgi:hypothetical protein